VTFHPTSPHPTSPHTEESAVSLEPITHSLFFPYSLSLSFHRLGGILIVSLYLIKVNRGIVNGFNAYIVIPWIFYFPCVDVTVDVGTIPTLLGIVHWDVSHKKTIQLV
jgi:hypothetical protein